MGMRVALIHPAGSNWVPGRRDISAIANRMAPLGILSMAAYLVRSGHAVLVYDCLGPGVPKEKALQAKQILEFSPDLAGFSTTTAGFLDGCDLAQRLKTANPAIKTIFGGVHVSAMGAPLLTAFPMIDFLCLGEGENVLKAVADGQAAATIAGLVRRDGNQTKANDAAVPMADLDDLPFPAYEKLHGFPKGYHLPLFSYVLSPGATMITSRGCPYQCSYCDRSVFKKSYRTQSAAYIYAHLKYLNQRFKIRHVNIYDDLFTMDRHRIAALCSLLIAKPLGLQLNCAVRVGHVDGQLLKMLKAAGFLMLSIGIETASPDLMRRHKPGVGLETVRQTVKQIQARGLRVKGLFMMGLPGETQASIKATSDFVISLGLDDMNMSKFTPFYGAPIWDRVARSGRFENNWRKMNCLNFVYLPENIPSIKILDNLYNQHVQRFYRDPAWRRKFRRRLWDHRHSIWHMIKNGGAFLSARRTFEPTVEK
jgi:anaerobic magnesium-protoporphyrin IX monomethyl ester cyclase